MSTDYFIADVQKVKDYSDFKQFWKEELVTAMENMITDYCKEHSSAYFANELFYIFDSDVFYKLKYSFPLDDDDLRVRIGNSSMLGFTWIFEGSEWCEESINDFPSVQRFLMQHPECCILDEYGNTVSIDEFCEISSRKRKE